MSSFRYIFYLLALIICISPASFLSAQEVASVDNQVESVSLNEAGILEVSGQVVPDLGVTQDVYLQAVLSDKEGVTRDRVLIEEELDYNTTYTHEFDFAMEPVTSDRVVLMTVTRDGIPLDIDPLTVAWNENTLTTRSADSLDIIRCSYQASTEELRCNYRGNVATTATVRLYEGQPHRENLLDEFTNPVQVENETMIIVAFEPRVEDGLYTYTISDQAGVMLHQGSVRVGTVPIPELRSPEELAREANMKFMLQIGGLLLGFVMLVLVASQWLVGRGARRYVWTSVALVVLSLLGYWYYAQAAVYQSTDYPQFTYTVDVTPVQDDDYYLSFAAFDTFAGVPPMDQEVEITFDGVNYEPLIQSNTGESAHVRSITVNEREASTTAIRVVDGCASYYGFSEYDNSTYGRHDCGPYPLFPSDESIIGCMDPGAVNYNPDAVISSDDCDYRGCTIPGAINYDPSATINDGSCDIEGCMNPEATNYDPDATIDDGSCVCADGDCEDIYGCMDPTAPNYDPDATIDDGSCGTCVWTPVIPDPSTYCTTEVYTQTNTCTGDTRTVRGLQTTSWLPDVDPSDICVGYSVTQTQQCSGLSVPPTRVVAGTATGPFCIRPEAQFEVSTNLNNWTTCDALGRIQMARSDQVLYLRPTGTEPANSWSVAQAAGEVSGTVTREEGDVWKAQFTYNVAKKQYNDVQITMTSDAGNTTTQSCDLSLLDFEFEER